MKWKASMEEDLSFPDLKKINHNAYVVDLPRRLGHLQGLLRHLINSKKGKLMQVAKEFLKKSDHQSITSQKRSRQKVVC